MTEYNINADDADGCDDDDDDDDDDDGASSEVQIISSLLQGYNKYEPPRRGTLLTAWIAVVYSLRYLFA